VEDLPSVATDGPHRPDDQPRDDEFGLMSRYLAKMGESVFCCCWIRPNARLKVKERWPMFHKIESKAPDWPGDTQIEGLRSDCVWKPEDGESPFHFLEFIG